MVLINMTNNFLAFLPGYCIHIGAISPITLSPTNLLIETIAIKIEKDIIPQKIIKKGSKNMTDFLQTPNKLSSKKRDKLTKASKKQV